MGNRDNVVIGYTVIFCGVKPSTASVTIRELRSGLADMVGCLSYGSECPQVTKNRTPAAVLIGRTVFELLERLRTAREKVKYRSAQLCDVKAGQPE